MDSQRFDAATRLLALPRSRRLAIPAGIASIAGLLGIVSSGPDVEAARKAVRRRRRQHDRKERRREQRRDKRKQRRNERKNAQCGPDEKMCGNACIGADLCCTSDECTGANAGQCVNNTCQSAFQTCAAEDGTVSFVDQAPGDPPLSKGAVRFTIGPSPAVNDWAHLRSSDFAGVALADIKKLEFSTYVEPLENGSCPSTSPFMALYALAGGTEHILVSAEGRTPTLCNTWQTIDAASLTWWMPTNATVAPRNNPKTLAEIASAIPGIAIRNAVTTDAQCPTALGGLRLEFGEFPGGGGTGDAVVYVSYLTVEIGNTSETFLF